MADPVVHITNGIPDSGTGNITTLGMIAALLPAALGAGGGLKVDGSGTALPVSGSVSISGTATISGTVTANAGTNLNTSALALEAGGNLASLVTQLGAVTASPTANTISDRLKVINTTLGSPFQAGGSIGNATFGASQSGTWTVQPGNTQNTTPWLVAIHDGTNLAAVKAGSTAAVAGDKSLVVALSPNINGQKTMANSVPVVLASDQGPLAVGGSTGSDASTTITLGGTAQNLFAGVTPTNGFGVYNCDASEDLWISLSTTAAVNGTGCIRIAANGGGYESPLGMKPFHAISIIGATTGHKFTAVKW